MQIIGLDIGFGFSKITDGSQFLTFKSIIGDAVNVQFRETVDMENQPLSLHTILDGRSYFVGDLAERQSSVRYFTLDQRQFFGNSTKTLALTALSNLVAPNEPARIVTGLPIRYLRQHKKPLEQLLVGEHVVTTVDDNEDQHEVVLNIEDVRVVPQPFGSVFSVLLNDQGTVADSRYRTEKIGVIDVGFCTSDYTISDRTRYLERGSQTSDLGIASAFRRIAAELEEESEIDVPLYRLYDAVDRGSIRIRGKTIDIAALSQKAFNDLATGIANEVERLWAEDWDIDEILISGGGGKVLAPYLEPLLVGDVHTLGDADDARLNNVIGYWRYGRNQWGKQPSREAPTADVTAEAAPAPADVPASADETVESGFGASA